MIKFGRYSNKKNKDQLVVKFDFNLINKSREDITKNFSKEIKKKKLIDFDKKQNDS